MYDGPFCILSIVDNRTFKRLAYQVLNHDPNHTDIEAFFRRFHEALQTRGLTLRGITTDGSPLYPEAITTVFGTIPHQICTFHVLREITKAVLSAVAKVRKALTASAPRSAAVVPAPRPANAPYAGRSGSSTRWASCSSTVTCSSSVGSPRRSVARCGGSVADSPTSALCAS